MLPLLAMASQMLPSVPGSVISYTGQQSSQTSCTLAPLAETYNSLLAIKHPLLSRMDHVTQTRVVTARTGSPDH